MSRISRTTVGHRRTGRNTHRSKDTEAQTLTGTRPHRHTDTQTHRHRLTVTKTHGHACAQTHRHTNAHTDSQTHKLRDTESHRYVKNTATQRHSDQQTRKRAGARTRHPKIRLSISTQMIFAHELTPKLHSTLLNRRCTVRRSPATARAFDARACEFSPPGIPCAGTLLGTLPGTLRHRFCPR